MPSNISEDTISSTVTWNWSSNNGLSIWYPKIRIYKQEKIAILPYLVLTPVLFLLGGMLVYYLINQSPLTYLCPNFNPQKSNSNVSLNIF